MEDYYDDLYTDDADDKRQVEILIDILQKMFQIVGCKIPVLEIINLSVYEQSKLWKQYTLSEEQFEEWYDYYISRATDLLGYDADEEEIEETFKEISEHWAFKIDFSDKTNTDVKNTL